MTTKSKLLIGGIGILTISGLLYLNLQGEVQKNEPDSLTKSTIEKKELNKSIKIHETQSDKKVKTLTSKKKETQKELSKNFEINETIEKMTRTPFKDIDKHAKKSQETITQIKQVDKEIQEIILKIETQLAKANK